MRSNIVTFLREKSPLTTKREMNAALEQCMDDYQHTHDTLWRILTVLCEEFGMEIGIKPRSLVEEESSDRPCPGCGKMVNHSQSGIGLSCVPVSEW